MYSNLNINNFSKAHHNAECGIHSVQLLKIVETHNPELSTPQHLMYFCTPDIKAYPLDLAANYENYIYRRWNTKNNTFIEDFIMSQVKKNGNDDVLAGIDVCTQRSILILLMQTPYGQTGDWSLIATKFKGKIYLTREKKETGPIKRIERETYLFKLRQYCFASDPHSKPVTDVPVDENKQLFATFLLRLNEMKILFSTEIQGSDTDVEVKNASDANELAKYQQEMVMLKIAAQYKRDWSKGWNIYKWAIQAYLIGCNKILVGLKSWKGQISEPLQLFTLEQLSQNQIWKLSVGTAFLHKFLEMVKSAMSGVDCPYTAYVFSYAKGADTITTKVHSGKTEYSYLSEEFVNFMQTESK